MAILTDTELALCDLIWFGPSRGHDSVTVFDIHFPNERHTKNSQQKSQTIAQFKQRDNVKARLAELREESTQRFRESIAELPAQFGRLAMDPKDRFAFLPHELVERTNAKTGEVLGYVSTPVVQDPYEVPQHLWPYVEEFKFEALIGKFVVIPRELVGEKTRAKYADMVAKMGGAYAPERLEVSGRDGQPVETINTTMSAVEAAEIYKKSIKGEA